MAQTVIAHALADGANEVNRYAVPNPPDFAPVNQPLTSISPARS